MLSEIQGRQDARGSDLPRLKTVPFQVNGRSLSLLAREGTLDEAIIAEVQATYRIADLVSRCRSQASVTVYDIGAHIGTFAAIMAALLPQAVVRAFEPAPENFAMLERNLHHLGVAARVQATMAAVGAKKGFFSTDAIQRSPDTRNTGGHSVSGVQLVDAPPVAGAAFAAMVRLDELLERETRVDILKIDCEGSEFEILYTLTPEQLAKIDTMLGEIHNCVGFAGSMTNGQEWNGPSLKRFLADHYAVVSSSHRIETETAVLETFHATRQDARARGFRGLLRLFSRT